MKKHLIVVALVLMSIATYSYNNIAENKKAKTVGTALKNYLENLHYRNAKVDDDLSKKAFDEYLKRIDYSKQFLLQKDVDDLVKYKDQLDDQMVSGNHQLAFESMQILKNRVHTIEQFRKTFFKNKDINFTAKEKLELDPKKRSYLKDEAELKDYWRKTFVQAVLTRYLSSWEEQNVPPKEDKKSTKKPKKKAPPAKKLTDKELLSKAVDAVDKKYKKYFDRLQKEEFDDYIEKFFNSVTAIFDPHTNYLPPKKKEDFDIDISGQLEGIGAVLSEDGSYIKVVTIIPGGAAWRQKDLEVEDVILLVTQENGEVTDLVDMRVDDAVRFIRGPKDSVVKLTVKKVDGTIKVIPITRDVVQIEENFAKSSVIEHKKLGLKVGYIYVPKFYRDFNGAQGNVTDDVRAELERLKKDKVTGVILDLRNNGGGALEDARLMSGLFIEKGPIVQVKDHRAKIDIQEDTNSSVTYDGALIVLINKYSASASEIVAAAMQDYKRAVVVGGEVSHGKGTVQAVVNLNHGPLLSLNNFDMGALKITIQKFYRINGGSTQYKGVTPDVILPDPYAYTEGQEQELDYSLPWDKIEALKYNVWTKHKVDLESLKKRSAERVKTNKRFEVIKKSVDYLTKRREDTAVSLNIDEVKAEDAANKKMAEELKLEDINPEIVVSRMDESLLAHSSNKINKNDQKWKEEFETRKKDWAENLQKDPILEESLYIMDDLAKMSELR
jgi:carboxyl-terminal processing protease